MESVENNPKDLSFYASLQDQEFTTVNDTSNNNFDEVTEQRESDKENDIDDNIFFIFLDEIKPDYETSDQATRVKSGSMIRVQVESIKRRKSERSGGGKRKLPGASNMAHLVLFSYIPLNNAQNQNVLAPFVSFNWDASNLYKNRMVQITKLQGQIHGS
ncbi:22769_t:CDS:2, partial [Gigaspora rosea]